MKSHRIHLWISLLTVVLATTACKKEDSKHPQNQAGETHFSDNSPRNSKNSQSGNGVGSPEPSVQVIIGLKITDLNEAELARWQGVGVETVVVDGAILTADMPEVKPPFENGAPICVLEFDSAASLTNEFKVVKSETDDTQETMQTNLLFQDHEQNNLTIRCLHLKKLSTENLQETFRKLLEFQLQSQ